MSYVYPPLMRTHHVGRSAGVALAYVVGLVASITAGVLTGIVT